MRRGLVLFKCIWSLSEEEWAALEEVFAEDMSRIGVRGMIIGTGRKIILESNC
jgi:hypothetical protein